jgi:tungstate transport system substrate-binding protein
VVLAAALLALAAWQDAGAQTDAPARDVVLATTTSLHDTGLLDSLAPLFERATGFRLRVVALGSGQALRVAERGDADVVMAHAPAAERAFMAAGHGSRRRVVAWNYFTIVGPPEDPADVRAAASVTEAMARIALRGAAFASRGDSSGTHRRELELWRLAGSHPGRGRYLETGQGMAATLLVASERRAYALTDRGTFGSLRGRLDLVELRGPEATLLNVYHVMEVNPAGRPRLNVAGARAFADWIVSDRAQDLLARFGETQAGTPLFTPARGREPVP